METIRDVIERTFDKLLDRAISQSCTYHIIDNLNQLAQKQNNCWLKNQLKKREHREAARSVGKKQLELF